MLRNSQLLKKELKLELFNIYDVVVFEDETGITQDCVCVITNWEKEADEVVSEAKAAIKEFFFFFWRIIKTKVTLFLFI